MAEMLQIYDYIHAEVPTASRALVLQNIRNSAVEFFEQSLAWQEVIGPLRVIKGKRTYELVPEDCDAVIHKIILLKRRGTNQDPGEGNTQRVDIDFVMKERDVVELCVEPTDSVNRALRATVALRPYRHASTLPDNQFETWYEAIAAGAKYRLMRMSKVAWSDRDLAKEYQREFFNEVRRAQGEWRKGYTNKNLINTFQVGQRNNAFVV
jgi:hypothetical protein